VGHALCLPEFLMIFMERLNLFREPIFIFLVSMNYFVIMKSLKYEKKDIREKKY